MYGEMEIKFFSELTGLTGSDFEVTFKMDAKITGLLSEQQLRQIAALIEKKFSESLHDTLDKALNKN